MIYFAVVEKQMFGLRDYLATWGRPLAGRLSQVTYHELFRRRSMPRGAWIFSALEHLSSAGRGLAECCWRAAAEAGLPVLNCPSRVLSRHELLKSLHHAGINQFRAIRADEPVDGLRYPVFLRDAAEHDGNRTPLLRDSTELARALAAVRNSGEDLRTYLVVEFCETVGSDGLYRTYCVYRVGDRYIPTHLHLGRQWMMKLAAQVKPEQIAAEELDFVRSNPHGEWVRDIFERARIEYGRIDYSVHAGRPQAWEINLCPTLARLARLPRESPEERREREQRQPAREFAHAALRDAFERIYPGQLPKDNLEVHFPRELDSVVRAEEYRTRWQRRRELCRSALARLPGLRPIKNLLLLAHHARTS
jgi:hypothetical protein